MRMNLTSAGHVLIVGMLLGPSTAHARLMKSYQAPSDNIGSCAKQVQVALARVKQRIPVHFFCEAGHVQQLWFTEASGISKQWQQFVLENGDLFAPKDATLKRSEFGVERYWKGLRILNNRIQLVSADPNGQFIRQAKMGLTIGILSDYPDTRNLTLGIVPKFKAAAASEAAKRLWTKERPGGFFAVNKTELALYWLEGEHPRLAWVISGLGTMKKDEPSIPFSCTVNADTGIPEKYDCSSYGYSL